MIKFWKTPIEKISNRLNRENEIKQYAIDYWIGRLSNEIEYHENVKINPELHKPEIMTNEEWISRCDKVISMNNNYLARLRAGDYELCKELESQEREA